MATNTPLHTPHPLISTGKLKFKTREVLVLLSKGMTLKGMAKELNKDRASVRYHLRKLKKIGFCHNDNTLWQITPAGRQHLSPQTTLKSVVKDARRVRREGVQSTSQWQPEDRAHNIKIKFPISSKPESLGFLIGWRKNEAFKNNPLFHTEKGDVGVTYTGKSMIFQLPIIRANAADIALAEAYRLAKELKMQYERDVPGMKLGDLIIDNQVISQHHALQNDPFSVFCKEKGITYLDKEINVDASGGSPETEFVGKDSYKHFDNYLDFMREIMQGEIPKPSDLSKLIYSTQEQLTATLESIRNLAESQKNTQLQLNTLVELIKPLKSPQMKPFKKETIPDYVF